MAILRPINAQAVFAVTLLVLTTGYASQIPELGRPFSNGVEPGASFLPIVLSAVMYLFSVRILIRELRRGRQDTAGEQQIRSDHVPHVALLGPAAVIAATVIFTAALPVVGYFLATSTYTFAVAMYFNLEETGRWMRSAIWSAATAAAITVFCWLFFVELFDLNLPTWSL